MLRKPASLHVRELKATDHGVRLDQFLDAGFNLAIASIALGVVVGVWMLFNRTGLAAVGNDAVDLFASGLVMFTRRVAPSVPLYAGATALLVSALGLWWWAEKDTTA